MRKKGKGGHYYARFYDSSRSPKRKEVPLDTTRKKVARRRLVELEEQFEAGEFDPWTDPADRERLIVREAIGRFLEAKREAVRDSTFDTYEQQLTAWSKTCPPGLTIRTVGPDHLQSFIRTYRADDDEDKAPSNATQRKRYRHLQAFVNWLLDEGIIEQDPMRSVDKPKKQKKQPSFLSPSDLETLIAEIEDHVETVTNIHGELSDVQWLKDVIQFAVCTDSGAGSSCHSSGGMSIWRRSS